MPEVDSSDHADLWQVERFVSELACVIEYYLRNAGAEESASRLGIKKSMMFKYLHSAHEHIDKFMNTTSDF